MHFCCCRRWSVELCRPVVALPGWGFPFFVWTILQCSFSWGPCWFHPIFLCRKGCFLISLDPLKYYEDFVQFIHCVSNSPVPSARAHLHNVQLCRKTFWKTTHLKYQVVHRRLLWWLIRIWELSLGLEPCWYFRLSLFGSGFWIILPFLICLVYIIRQWVPGS